MTDYDQDKMKPDKTSRTYRAKPVIGVFTAQLDDGYQSAVWRGIEARAREVGIGVVCFVGRRIESPDTSEATANVVYRMADHKNVDGLIIVSTTIATFIDKEEICRFFSHRKDMPQVSVGFKVPCVPSITVDGSGGIIHLVRHLVRDHGRSRFALLGGPPGHAEAEERERSFRKALAEEGITFDERISVKGDFIRNSGYEATTRLLSSGIPFDALFCMNDRMAFGALDSLHARGFRVPEDIAVAGFDGVEESKYKTPPLTTVIQPLRELGAAAVDTILELLEGGEPGDRILTCEPVIRQSCGCLPGRPFNKDLAELPLGVSAEVNKAVDDMVRLSRQGNTDGFIGRLNAILADSVRTGADLGVWNDYLSVVRHKSGTRGKTQNTDKNQLYEFSRVLIGEMENRHQAEKRVAAENKLAMLRSISASLSGAFQTPKMFEHLEESLMELGIGEGYLVLFVGIKKTTEWSRLVIAPKTGGKTALPEQGIRFRTDRLLPSWADASWRETLWVLEPLVFQEEPLGYMLLPGGVDEPAVYDTLSEQVAGALKGALLLKQVRAHERHLEEEVVRRTGELTRSNRELTREIERRMRLEREVLEISNRTMQRIGQDLHDDLSQHLAGVAMLASVLRSDIADSAPSAAASLDQIGKLLADSISRTKQIARGLYPAGLAEHGLASAVEELVESARRSHQVSIDFRTSPHLRLPDTDLALQVYRIIQEALTNALKHSQSDRIEVNLFYENRAKRKGKSDRSLMITEVIDYGIGIPDAVSEEGMGLRIMKYRAETAGIEFKIERLRPGTRVRCGITL